jgi:hypothetical protein
MFLKKFLFENSENFKNFLDSHSERSEESSNQVDYGFFTSFRMTFFQIFLFIFFLIFLQTHLYSQIAINEIQAAPAGEEPEWLELYNYSDNDVFLTNCYITDAVSSKKISEIKIPAKEFAILTKDTTALLNSRNIPSSAVLIEAKIPTYNNDWDIVTLRKSDSTLIDSVYYNMKWGKPGISLERSDWMKPAISNENLKPSLSPDSATCGYLNSVGVKDYDVAVKFEKISNDLILKVFNKGRNQAQQISWKILIDRDKDGLFNESDILYYDNIELINAGDSSIKTYKIEAMNFSITGYVNCKAIINFKNDNNQSNDTANLKYYISYPSGSILINEFLCDNSPDKAEFLELWNSTTDTIYLSGWSLNDKAHSQINEYMNFDSPKFLICPKGYAVLAWDSLFLENYPELAGLPNIYVKNYNLNLNSTGDEIVIHDPNFLTQDSISYGSNQCNKQFTSKKNISFEKINPSLLSNDCNSWSLCSDAAGATPAKENSVAQSIDKKGNLIASPNPFSPFSQGKDKFCVISYNLPFKHAAASANIFDTNGALLRKLASGDNIYSTGEFVWDGTNDKGYNLPVGPYIFLLEAVDNDSGNVFNEKILIVIGK